MLRDKVQIEKPVTVREARCLMGMTQATFSRLIGMAKATYIRKEYGEYPWREDELKKISEVTGIARMLITEDDYDEYE